jgi:hypothetical protein
MINFNLDANEAAFIIRVIGQLPTESGAFPLHQKLVEQFKQQQEVTDVEPK